MTTPEKLLFAPALRSLLDEEGRSNHPTPERLIDYRSGWLSPAETRLVEEHLGTCQECSELLGELAAFEEVDSVQEQITEPVRPGPIHLLPSPQFPAVAHARDRPASQTGSLRRQLQCAYALAAALACVAVGLAIWGGRLNRQVTRLNEPSINLTILDLYSDAERGEKIPTAAVAGDRMVFLLHPPSDESGVEGPSEYRAQIRKIGDKEPSLLISGLHRGDGGALSFGLRRSSVLPGDYQVELSKENGEHPQLLGIYHFSVSPENPSA